MIEARKLRKVYGQTVAVDGIDFQVKPGHVTGFLGPNGAGKSTTMRMILGLDLPTSGTVTVDGCRYQGTVWPLHEVGALLDARAVHRAGPRTTTCTHWPRPTASPAGASTRCSIRSGSRRWRASGSAGSPWACRSGSVSPGRCSATGDAAVRRAGQRPRPGRDPVDQDSHALAGRRGPHGAGLEPPDERDGANRGPSA